jgi:hypothetical protein
MIHFASLSQTSFPLHLRNRFAFRGALLAADDSHAIDCVEMSKRWDSDERRDRAREIESRMIRMRARQCDES